MKDSQPNSSAWFHNYEEKKLSTKIRVVHENSLLFTHEIYYIYSATSIQAQTAKFFAFVFIVNIVLKTEMYSPRI